MMFDDEHIVSIGNAYSENEDEFTVGKAKLKIICKSTAPLDQTKLRVLLQMTGLGERPGLDLVTVLDVSSSMKGEKLNKLKKVMEFVIKKLSPIDRLSVVTFSDKATRLCPLRVVTDKAHMDIIDLVKGVNAGGWSNINQGLEMALQILKGRRFTDGRSIGVMLMSGGEQNEGRDAAQVHVQDVPVYTFGFGKGGCHPKAVAVLNGIAKESKGGTFTDIRNINDLSITFAQCLVELLTVAVKDLNFIISSPAGSRMPGKELEKNAKIEKVYAGDYDQSIDNDSVLSVAFGNLYMKETQKIIVDLILPKVPKEISLQLLKISYNYSNSRGRKLKSPPVFVSVKRTWEFTKEEEEEVIVEGSRLETARMMNEARVLADNHNNLNGAKNKFFDTQNMLEDVEIDEPENSIDMLKAELQQLMIFIQSPDLDKNSGLPDASSSEMSHKPQHFSTRGDLEKLGLLSTPHMVAYSEQAKSFYKDPTKPLPTTEEDVKEEILADPLVSIAGALSVHIHAAVQALQAVESTINVLLHVDR